MPGMCTIYSLRWRSGWWVANSIKVKQIATASVKTDIRDALILARLLAANRVPERQSVETHTQILNRMPFTLLFIGVYRWACNCFAHFASVRATVLPASRQAKGAPAAVPGGEDAALSAEFLWRERVRLKVFWNSVRILKDLTVLKGLVFVVRDKPHDNSQTSPPLPEQLVRVSWDSLTMQVDSIYFPTNLVIRGDLSVWGILSPSITPLRLTS